MEQLLFIFAFTMMNMMTGIRASAAAGPLIHHGMYKLFMVRTNSEEGGRKDCCRGWNFSVGTLVKEEGLVMVGSTSEGTPFFLIHLYYSEQ
jgi:hypothetical protein